VGEADADLDWNAADGINTSTSAAPRAGDTTINASAFYDDDDDDIGDNSYYQSRADTTLNTTIDIGSELLAQPKFIKKIEINYAKTAKKVDVKKLKENIWKKLATEETTKAGKEVEKVQGKKDFSQVISTLSDVYPDKKMKDISVPFCFICLLHLANEKNLSLENPKGSLTSLTIIQN